MQARRPATDMKCGNDLSRDLNGTMELAQQTTIGSTFQTLHYSSPGAQLETKDNTPGYETVRQLLSRLVDCIQNPHH